MDIGEIESDIEIVPIKEIEKPGVPAEPVPAKSLVEAALR